MNCFPCIKTLAAEQNNHFFTFTPMVAVLKNQAREAGVLICCSLSEPNAEIAFSIMPLFMCIYNFDLASGGKDK